MPSYSTTRLSSRRGPPALDEFIASVHTTEDLPGWAEQVVAEELREIHQSREFLTSAIMKYHHGDLAPRPDTVLDKPSFELSTVTIRLAP
ncbi:hypothetical protein AB0899_28780 [Streptomyces sp. NPDC007002]|uniref:hypothetical protein n=1 Tax=Streptomyces sp. NPDC007002 TaxID=3156910 RepID=UPI003457114D